MGPSPRRYLEKLRWHCQALPLAALGGEEGTEEELTLDRVYIDLDTKTPVENEAGLDEVPFDLGERVRHAVTAVIRQYALQLIIVTCRVRSYVGATVLPNFQAHILAPFDRKKIEAFTVAWYNAQKEMGRFNAEQAGQKAKNLAQAALSKDLRELAENPMMLTTMAIIHQREIGLPKERVRLYYLAVDVLLRRWQKRKSGESAAAISPALVKFLHDDLSLRAVMERLAYEAHRAGKGEKVAQAMEDLARGTALALLEASEYLGSAALAAEFLDYVDQRAGLLLGKGGDEKKQPVSYSFPHRTFQEYLAGCFVVGQRNPARQYLLLVEEGDYWAQAAQLGAEELLYNRRGDTSKSVFDLAYRLCPSHDSNTTASRRACLWSGNIAALLGHEALARDAAAPDGDKTYLDRLLPRLQTFFGSDLSASERAEAGVALALLGDPRREVTSVEEMQFCLVPAGPFWMGSDKSDEEASYDEQPLNRYDKLDYDFWMAQYPVTVAQFRAFVEASKHKPEDAESLSDLPNQPMVDMTWHEAVKFCEWLTQKWQREGKLSKDWAVHLPSEAEWEKAARGGLKIPVDPIIKSIDSLSIGMSASLRDNPERKRRYPWGDETNPNFANYYNTGIGTTSAVGCFPNGMSPYGVQDLSGNVEEWTRSLWGTDWNKLKYKYPYNPKDGREKLDASDDIFRVLRGGAIRQFDRSVRCADRSRSNPNDRYGNAGFRVVLRPLL